MQHFLVKDQQKYQEQGYNLLELIIVMFLISIGAALAVPSLVGQYNQNQVKDATLKLKSILTTAQANATKSSSSCYLNFSASGSQPPVIDSFDGSSTNCTLGTPDFNDNVTIKHNFTDITYDFGTVTTSDDRQYHLEYNYKGNTKDTGTIVLYDPDNTSLARCTVVSNGLGMIRQGFYDGADPSTPGHVPSSTNCTIIQP